MADSEKNLALLLKEENVSEIWAIAPVTRKIKTAFEEESGDGNIRTFSMDLSDRASIAEIEKEPHNSAVTVKYLVNNAGFAKFCSYGDISIEESLNMIDLNISAVVALGLVCIPYMEKGSHIINIASQASFFPLPIRTFTAQQKLLYAITPGP